MAEDIGFFEQLTGSPVDESAIEDAQYAKAMSHYRTSSRAQGARGGAQLAQGIAQLFGKTKWAAEHKDSITAKANGISVDELRSRRQVRKEMVGMNDDGSIKDRRAMAEAAARISNDNGDSQGLARALGAIKKLDVEDAEWKKLQADQKSQKGRDLKLATVTGYTSDGTPQTGTLGIDPATNKPGMWTEVGGELLHKPWGEGFSLEDRTKDAVRGRQERTVGQRIRDIATPTELTKIRNLASSANSALSRTDRILSSMSDSANGGGVESMIGTSGGLITSIDNFARNINGVIGAFASEGSSNDNNTLRSGLGRRAKDADDFLSQFVVLPEGVERTSAAAQQHRANVMEMAYMAARLAEPSNRGLSDNDIKNALTRIAGDTSNPQVMMRRFLEMQVDASDELDFAMKLFHSSLDGVSNERIDEVIGGEAIPEYRKRKKALFEKFGVERTDAGRVVFGEKFGLGTDVQPGEAVLNNGGPGTAPADELDDDSFLNSVLGTPEETE